MPTKHDNGRLLLLIPKTSYRAQDFLAAAEQLGADVAVGSNHRSTLENLSQGKTVKFNFKTRLLLNAEVVHNIGRSYLGKAKICNSVL